MIQLKQSQVNSSLGTISYAEHNSNLLPSAVPNRGMMKMIGGGFP